MIQIIIGAVASTYDKYHPKFHIRYLRDKPILQRNQAKNFLLRQNIGNPCANKNIINLRPPRINSKKYTVTTLGEFVHMTDVEGVAIPKHEEMTEELKIALYDWNNGNAGINQAPFYWLLVMFNFASVHDSFVQ